MKDNNIAFKSFRGVFGLRDDDVVRIISLGGLEVSKSRVNAWGRGPESVKRGTGNSEAKRMARHRDMKDEEFRAFCFGLKLFFREE